MKKEPQDISVSSPAAAESPAPVPEMIFRPAKSTQPVQVEPSYEMKRLESEVTDLRTALEQWTQAEETWSRQRRLFKVIAENVKDLIVLMDASGNRTWNNPAYRQALGFTDEELAGTYALSEVHPDDRARAIIAFEQALTLKGRQHATYRVGRKDGAWIQLETEIVAIVDADGTVESLVLTAHDVTEQKRLEQIAANVSAEAKAVGMVEQMARDFDHILTNVFGNLTIARNLNGPHNAVALRLSEIERSLQRARDLIEQMFSLSPHPEGPKAMVPLEPVLHEAVAAVLRGTMVRAEYNLARHLPDVELDVEGFGHAIRNLITNSLQAMDKGVIRLSAEYVSQEQFSLRQDIAVKPGNYVCLIIQDQGAGMSESTLQSAFEPYFTTRQDAQGLGLTTALSSIQRMGGTILLESIPSVGTTAYVYLPAVHMPAKKTRTGTTALPKIREKSRVLLMDDEQMILDIVSRMLTHLGYDVSICTDGSQAIALFTKAKSAGQPFDVVLMDLVIPNGVGGQDAVHTIRKIDPHAKVIASSGHLEHPVMVDHKKFGFVASLEKPYKLERLQQVIDAVIETPA
jgi:two-component system cell cycle sensor histidine kinase/response regulator CckA